MSQETWLPENRLSDLSQLGVQFVARSGMEDAISRSIYKGRPHGGVCIAWSPDMDHVIKPLVNYKYKRIVCVEMSAQPNPIIFASIYMPFFDTSKRQECIAESVETIAMLEEILADHPQHKFILGGDFNTEFVNNSPFDQLWREFNQKHDLVCCDSLVSNNNNNNHYTYIHNSLNHRKWNNHFLVSSSILSSTDNHCILDDGDNPSDHLPIIMQLSICTTVEPEKVDPPVKLPSLKWEKCSEEHKTAYNNRLSNLLARSPSEITKCEVVHCDSRDCTHSIQREYEDLTRIIKESDKVLPRHRPGVQKSWWTAELTRLRNQSMDIHHLWQAEGKPRSGITHNERLRVRAAYRHGIKSAQRAPKQACWNRMHGTFINKSASEFWKSWKQLYNKNKSSLHTVVNGVSGVEEIADSFKNHFVKISQPNNQQRVNELNHTFHEKYKNATQTHLNCNCSSYAITLENVLDASFKLQKGKCSDDALVNAEHFFNAPLGLFDRLQLLFSKMLLHGYVPYQFQRGTIIPIVKDRHGDNGNMNNYRGITIAPIISKIFEHTLQIVFQSFLTTSHYQFGFKKRSLTSHAIYCLKETIDYYTSHGSNVYCSFLDASKAFDRLVHAGLFLKLLQRGIPLLFLNIIITWYADLRCRVRWGETPSDWFDVKAGVRQCGILSPTFYCIYVDDLVDILSELGVGCHLKDLFLSILLYADDMALTSPSLRGLQQLLSATELYCKTWDIMLNPKKSKNMSFGKKHSLASLHLDGTNIDWVESWPYLGVTIKSHSSFNCCVEEKVKSFYRVANAILRIEGRSNEMVMLQLLETHCLSILTYAIEVIYVANSDERRKLRVAYNSLFRRVFNYRTWESVTDLQHSLHRPTWEELIARRRDEFHTRIMHSDLLCQFA